MNSSARASWGRPDFRFEGPMYDYEEGDVRQVLEVVEGAPLIPPPSAERNFGEEAE